MGNKIIIDGVDVAGCEFYEKERALYPDDDYTAPFWVKNYCRLMIEGEFSCEGSDCYYKQLQRKIQECERLKKNYRLSCLKCEYKNTKVENEQLKEDLTALQQTYEACAKEYKALSIKYSSAVSFMKKNTKSYTKRCR